MISVLLDGMELSGTDEDDIPGGDRFFLKIRGHDAAPFFDDDQFRFGMPVKGHSGKIPGNGAQISIIGKIRSSVGFGLMVILVFADIHRSITSLPYLIVLYNEREEYCKKYPQKHIILLSRGCSSYHVHKET